MLIAGGAGCPPHLRISPLTSVTIVGATVAVAGIRRRHVILAGASIRIPVPPETIAVLLLGGVTQIRRRGRFERVDQIC